MPRVTDEQIAQVEARAARLLARLRERQAKQREWDIRQKELDRLCLKVAELRATGMTYKQIAAELDFSSSSRAQQLMGRYRLQKGRGVLP